MTSHIARSIFIDSHGGPDVMKIRQGELPPPPPGNVTVQHAAVGINLADTYFRSGLYPGRPPHGLGVEGAGTIVELGPGVSGYAVGDRVTYTGSPLGAYCDVRNMPVDSLIPLPDTIAFDVAAASTMRGLTATYLLNSVWDLSPGDTVLIQAAAGGVGLIFCQMAKNMGLHVIGTVGSDNKRVLAKDAGCDHVLNSKTDDIPAQVRELTSGLGARMVVDGVGGETFDASLSSVARRGLLVCLGTASGPVVPFDPPRLMRQGSVYVTRPAMADYIAQPDEKMHLVSILFSHLNKGSVKVSINQRWTLDDAVAAHLALEAGTTTGSSIFEFTQ